jgi:hypothetical protein
MQGAGRAIATPAHFGGSVGCNEVPTHLQKNHLNQMLKYLYITMSAKYGNAL